MALIARSWLNILTTSTLISDSHGVDIQLQTLDRKSIFLSRVDVVRTTFMPTFILLVMI